MRLLDETTNKRITHIGIYLLREEARELKSGLEQLLSDVTAHHSHVSSDDYQKEITICIYDETTLEGFDDRSKKLIREDV